VPTLTFDQINTRVSAHHAAEAVRNAPKPSAIRAVYTLSSLLAELDAVDHAAVLELLRDEVLAPTPPPEQQEAAGEGYTGRPPHAPV
jgi:hypothetical protein